MTDLLAIAKTIKDAAVEGWRDADAAATRKNRLLGYWPRLFENVQFSPRQFYANFLENLEIQKIPDLEVNALTLRQSGVFSARRLYVQFRRERLVFELCAAPFGTGFFCSGRLYDRSREARWYHVLIATVLLSSIALLLWFKLGVFTSLVAFTGLLSLLWSLMRLSLVATMRWMEDQLFDLPLIGPIYQSLFHPDTYFRQDTNACYEQALHHALDQTIADLLKTKGVHGDGAPLTAPRVAELHLK